MTNQTKRMSSQREKATTAPDAVARLNSAISRAVSAFKPPDDITVTEWADSKRRLSPESSAEAGPWRTHRTPYLKEPMDAFTDPKVRKITVVSGSQTGKSELELNIIGYIIDQDPSSILYVQPTLDDARKFSRLRVAPMIRDCKCLKSKVSDVKGRDSGNTLLQKSFPGGMITICGSNSASALASTPVRYVIGDERDRWATSAGTEGDPWELAMARQTTFFNAKSVDVSTPTIKNASAIEASFAEGTQERWCVQCPDCGAWHDITFEDIRFEYTTQVLRGKTIYFVTTVGWVCPSCACFKSEAEVKAQPAKWIAENPDAYLTGVRSFWLNAFVSPWVSWKSIIHQFLRAKGDSKKLQVVYNTKFGMLWEDRGDIEDEDTMLSRREAYGSELPEGVLYLTCGVDTQDNRLEYEVVGFGHFGETWGIRRGVLMGRPDTDAVWDSLDDVIDHPYQFANGVALRISTTFIDSGGHYTQDVYIRCRARQRKNVFAITGQGGNDIPYTSPPKETKIVVNSRYIGTCWRYNLGVDAGKQLIMDSLRVHETGAKYCHFTNEDGKGYDISYFAGLLSERLIYKAHLKKPWVWEKIPGHERNEPLDCRNYAMAACKAAAPDFDALEQRMKKAEDQKSQRKPATTSSAKKRSAGIDRYYEEW